MSSYALHRDTTGMSDAELAAALLAEDDVGALLAQVEYDRSRRVSSMVGLPGGAAASTVFWAPPVDDFAINRSYASASSQQGQKAPPSASSHFDFGEPNATQSSARPRSVRRPPTMSPPREPAGTSRMVAPALGSDDDEAPYQRQRQPPPPPPPPQQQQRSRTGSLMPPPADDSDSFGVHTSRSDGLSDDDGSVARELKHQRRAFDEIATEDQRKREANEQTTVQLLAMAQSLARRLDEQQQQPVVSSSAASSDVDAGRPAVARPTQGRNGLVRSPVPRLHTEKVARFSRPASKVAADRQRRAEPNSLAASDSGGDAGNTKTPLRRAQPRPGVSVRGSGARRPKNSPTAASVNTSATRKADGDDSAVSPKPKPNISQLKLREEQRMIRHYRELCELSATESNAAGNNTSVVTPGGMNRVNSMASFDASFEYTAGVTGSPTGGGHMAPASPTTGVYQEPFFLNAPFAYSVHAGQTARANPRDSPATSPRSGPHLEMPLARANSSPPRNHQHEPFRAGAAANKPAGTGGTNSRQGSGAVRTNAPPPPTAVAANPPSAAKHEEKETQTPPRAQRGDGINSSPNNADDVEGDYYEPSAVKPGPVAGRRNTVAPTLDPDDSVDVAMPNNGTMVGVASADLPIRGDEMSPRHLSAPGGDEPDTDRDAIGDAFDDGVVSPTNRSVAMEPSASIAESPAAAGPRSNSLRPPEVAEGKGSRKPDQKPSSAVKPAQTKKSSSRAAAPDRKSTPSNRRSPTPSRRRSEAEQPRPKSSPERKPKPATAAADDDDKDGAAVAHTPPRPTLKSSTKESAAVTASPVGEEIDDTIVFHPGMSTQPLPGTSVKRQDHGDEDDDDDGSFGSGSYSSYTYMSGEYSSDFDSTSFSDDDDDTHTRRPQRAGTTYRGGRSSGPMPSGGRGGALQRSMTTGALRGGRGRGRGRGQAGGAVAAGTTRGGRPASASTTASVRRGDPDSVLIRGGYRTQDGVVVRVNGPGVVEVTAGEAMHTARSGASNGGPHGRSQSSQSMRVASRGPLFGAGNPQSAGLARSASAGFRPAPSQQQPATPMPGSNPGSVPATPVVVLRGGHRPGGIGAPASAAAPPPGAQRSVSMGALPVNTTSASQYGPPPPLRSASVIVRRPADAPASSAPPPQPAAAAVSPQRSGVNASSSGRLFGGAPPPPPGPITLRSQSAVFQRSASQQANASSVVANHDAPVPLFQRPPPPNHAAAPGRSATPPPPADRPQPDLRRAATHVMVRRPDGTFVPATQPPLPATGAPPHPHPQQQQQGSERRWPPPPPEASPSRAPYHSGRAADVDGSHAMLANRSQTMVIRAPPRSLYADPATTTH